MKIKKTYPYVEKRKLKRQKFFSMVRWLFLFAAMICPILNIVIGGAAWSLVVLMSLYTAWTLILSPDLVEYNRISQFIKAIICTCLLLTLIDVFLAPGWAIEVVPMVCFGGLVVSGLMFFTDIEKQKQNMLPMLLLIIFAIVGAVIGLGVWHEESGWALAVMGGSALLLLSACVVTLGNDFIREVKRRFHT